MIIELEQVLKIDLILWASALLELDHQSAIGHRYRYALHFSDLHLGLRFFVADTARLCHEIHGDLVVDSSNNPLLQIFVDAEFADRLFRKDQESFANSVLSVGRRIDQEVDIFGRPNQAQVVCSLPIRL